jgi:hypothetical protein
MPARGERYRGVSHQSAGFDSRAEHLSQRQEAVVEMNAGLTRRGNNADANGRHILALTVMGADSLA